MTTFLIILGVLALGAGVYFYAIKTGKIEDADGDLIADDAEELAAEVKRRAKNVKAELADVKKAAKELAGQAEDVIEAAKGKTKSRGRKPAKGKATKGSGKGKGKATKGSPKGKGSKASGSGSGSGRGRGKKK